VTRRELAVRVTVHNSHSAFVYTRWMRQDGIPERALTVVRLLENQP